MPFKFLALVDVNSLADSVHTVCPNTCYRKFQSGFIFLRLMGPALQSMSVDQTIWIIVLPTTKCLNAPRFQCPFS